MQAVIREIVKRKRSLADAFRFYERVLVFVESVRKLPHPPAGRRTAYSPRLVPEIIRSFSTLLGLPEGALAPLSLALELREIDFTRLPLGEVPAFSLPYAEDDLFLLLYLLSKPWFLALREECRLASRVWEEGRCPVCNSDPVITWIGEDNRRHASCLFCGTQGYVMRYGCLHCLAHDPARQSLLLFEGEKGFAVTTCDACRSYSKTVDSRLLSRWSPEVADLVSLPIDILIQEKGYARRSPNAIGLRKMSTRG